MTQYFPAIVTLFALLLLFGTGVVVAFAREKYHIKAPATTGNDDFERVFRVQMNTLENIILFLPALWLFSMYVSPLWAGIVGVIWLIGRVYYATSYIRSAEARGPGFGVGMLAFAILAMGAGIGIAQKILSGI